MHSLAVYSSDFKTINVGQTNFLAHIYIAKSPCIIKLDILHAVAHGFSSISLSLLVNNLHIFGDNNLPGLQMTFATKHIIILHSFVFYCLNSDMHNQDECSVVCKLRLSEKIESGVENADVSTLSKPLFPLYSNFEKISFSKMGKSLFPTWHHYFSNNRKSQFQGQHSEERRRQKAQDTVARNQAKKDAKD